MASRGNCKAAADRALWMMMMMGMMMMMMMERANAKEKDEEHPPVVIELKEQPHMREHYKELIRRRKHHRDFVKGSNLVFITAKEDECGIANVTEKEYKECELSSSAPTELLKLEDIPGSSTQKRTAPFMLAEAKKTYYFMCTRGKWCKEGMKFKIKVQSPTKHSNINSLIEKKIEEKDEKKEESMVADMKSSGTPSLTLISAAVAILVATLFLFFLL